MLARLLLGMVMLGLPCGLGCARRPPALGPGIELEEPAPSALQTVIHVNDSWWPWRARQLDSSELAARQRDARVGAGRAPAGFWDTQTAIEAVSVWTALCNQCHGGRRQLADVRDMLAPPPDWGAGTGLFFGNRRAYGYLFNVVHDGGPARDGGHPSMPAWRGILSNEMIWVLLYFLEYQSGGIESRFPPSLYPRPPKLLEPIPAAAHVP